MSHSVPKRREALEKAASGRTKILEEGMEKEVGIRGGGGLKHSLVEGMMGVTGRDREV